MGRLQFRQESLTIGTTSVELFPLVAEGERQIAFIKNTSTGGQKVSLAFGLGNKAVAGAGPTLDKGEAWIESIESTFLPTHENWFVVSDGAGATIAIYERQNKK